MILGLDEVSEVMDATSLNVNVPRPKYLNMTVTMTGVEEKRINDAMEAVIAGVPEEFRSLVKKPTTAGYLANRMDLFTKSPVWAQVIEKGDQEGTTST